VPPLIADEAVALFAERAALEVDGDRPVIEAICARLDRLPLAIELAAARVNVLPPGKLLERLEHSLPLLTAGARDAPERQRTLRATIAWSHDLLDDAERQLFARLAVFAGGCTLESAEVVCDADIDTLASLLDKNLLRRNETHYSMLETIREFALERFEDAADADELRRRHAEHFLAVALEAEPELVGRDQRRFLDLLEAEHDNLRAALSWLLDNDHEKALTLAHALIVFWYTHGHVREGRDWVVAALDRASSAPSAIRAGALDWAGYLSSELGDEGRSLAEQAVVCARDAGAAAALALALSHVPVTDAESDVHEAIAMIEEARTIAEGAGDPFVLGTVLNNLGVWVGQGGDNERSRALFHESYRVRAEAGDVSRMALSLNNFAWATFEAGDVGPARESAIEALALAREVGDRRHIWAALDSLGWIARADGRFSEARACFHEALMHALEISNASAVRGTLYSLATVASAMGEGRLTARLAGAARAGVAGAMLIDPLLSTWIEEALAAARAQTDPAEWEEAWAAGAALTLEQAAAEVLAT
jgi:tetratricopeptide (TPR) repeat protein